jgi:hypothetical protein
VDRPDEREVAEEMQRQRAARADDVAAGDLVLLLAAGTATPWRPRWCAGEGRDLVGTEHVSEWRLVTSTRQPLRGGD